MKQLITILVLGIASLYVGGCGGGGGNTPEPQPQPQPDTTPDAVLIEDLVAPAGTVIERNFDVTGISEPVAISIIGGEYSIDASDYTSSPGMVSNGQMVSVRVITPEAFSTEFSAVVTIGTAQVEVTAMSEAEDRVPDELNTDISIQTRDATFERTFSISGINTTVELMLSVGEYSVDGGEFTAAQGEVSSGQEVHVRIPVSAEFSQVVNATLTVGDTDFSLNIITEDEDLVPDNFSFATQVDVSPDVVITLAAVNITGINNVSPVSIENGEYSIDGAEFTSAPGEIFLSQTLVVRQTSSPEYETSVTTTVSISTTLDVTFTSTTHAERTPPEGSITFPWRTTISHEDTLIVRGVASDASGISTVTLNGAPATIDSVSQVDDLEIVEWSLEITVPEDQTTFAVSITDNKGNISVDNDSFTIQKSVATPWGFLLDEEHNRLIGNASGVALQVYNYESGEKTAIDNFFTAGNESKCIIPGSEEMLYVAFVGNGQYRFDSINLSNHLISNFAVIPYSDSEYNINQQAYFYHMVCTIDKAWVLMEAHLLGGGTSSRIIELDYSGGAPVASELLETGDANALTWTANVMHFSDGKFVTGQAGVSAKVQIIDLATLIITDASSQDFELQTLISDFENNFIYTVGEHDVSTIDSTTGDVEILSAGVDYDLFPRTAGTRSIAFLSEDNSIVVESHWINSLVKISRDTGERSIFYSESIGDGSKMRWNEALTIKDDNSVAYVLDSSDESDAILWRINLITGFRELVWRALTPYSAYARDIALDSENNIVYWGLSNAIRSYDADSFTLDTVADGLTGSGASLGVNFSLTFDTENNRLLVLDFSSSALIDVNLETKVRSVISKAGVRGDGPAINSGIDASVSLSADGSFVYISSESTSAIYTIDLTSGNRETFLTECLDDDGEDLFDGNQVMSVTLDPDSNKLFFTGGSLRAYDISTEVCDTLDAYDSSLSDVKVSNGRLLGIESNELLVIDPQSGSVAILSK